MLFYLTIIIVGLACSAITIKTLIGYADFKPIYKIIISALIVLGWFSIFIVNFLKSQTFLTDSAYAYISSFLYTLLGFVLILFVVITLRDVVWYLIYYILKLLKIDAWYMDPQNLSLLNKANMVVVIVALLISGYSFYEGNRLPNIVNETIYSNKISRNLRIVQISDLHITRATSNNKILSIINQQFP